MSLYDHLRLGLLAESGMRDLSAEAQQVALAWVKAGVEPSRIEVLSELLARMADHLEPETGVASLNDVAAASAWLELPAPVCELLEAALASALCATGLAALAVHVVDIAERAALQVFVPELPALQAKSDRSGNAARRVGAARHLRG